MVSTLTTKDHNAIYDTVRKNFSDFPLFDTLVSQKLRYFLSESKDLDINEKFTKNVFKRYFSVEAFKSPEQKALVYPLELIFQTACVLLVSHNAEVQHLVWKDKATFLEHYPQFNKGVDSDEVSYLLKFRNMMKIALTIIPARLNKGRLLQISGKLEGSGCDYITGSGQRIEVDRRVEIYQQEGKQKAVYKKLRSKRGSSHVAISDSEDDAKSYRLERKRRRTRNANSTPRKTYTKKIKRTDGVLCCTSSSFSNSKLKQMVMSDEMVKFLLDAPPNMPLPNAPPPTPQSITSSKPSSVISNKPQQSLCAVEKTASATNTPLRKSGRKRRPRAYSISDDSSHEDASSGSSSSSSNTSRSSSPPSSASNTPKTLRPGLRKTIRPPRPPPRLSDESLSSLEAVVKAARNGTPVPPSVFGRGRRGKATVVLAEKLFPKSRAGAPVLATSSNSGSNSSSSSHGTTDTAAASSIKNRVALNHVRSSHNNNLTIWHNMEHALSGFEDLLDLSEHSLVEDVLNNAVPGEDSLMTIFSLLTNKSDLNAPAEPSGISSTVVSPSTSIRDEVPDPPLPSLVKANSLGINSDDADVWGIYEMDSFTPHGSEGLFSPRLSGSGERSLGLTGSGSRGFLWEDDSVVLISGHQCAAEIEGGSATSRGFERVTYEMEVASSSSSSVSLGLTRNGSAVFNEKDAEVLLQIL